MIPTTIIKKGSTGNIHYQDIKTFDRSSFDNTKLYVEQTYNEEIKAGNLNAGQIKALTYLHSLKSLETVDSIKSILQLRRLYAANVKEVYKIAGHHTRGYDTIYEWLDSFGINPRSGTLSQLLRLAIYVIPWCAAYKIEVAGQPVNIDWFSQVIGGKCIASRATMIVSLFKNTTRSEAPLEKQKEIISLALAAVANPKFTRGYLAATFSGYSSPDKIKAYKYEGLPGVTLEADPAQTEWIQKKLSGSLDIQKVHPPLYTDMGYTWFNFDSLHPPFDNWRLSLTE